MEKTLGFYSLYIYKYDNSFKRASISDWVLKYKDMAEINIRNISDYSVEDKLKTINALIMRERARCINMDSMKKAYIQFIEYTSNRFLAIMSICESVMEVSDVKDMLQTVFTTSSFSYMSTANSEEVSKEFWKKASKDLYVAGKKSYDITSRLDAYDEYPFDFKHLPDFERMLKKEPLRAKSIVTAAAVTLMCKINDSASVLFEDIHDCGRLNKFPIIGNEKSWMGEGRQKIYESIAQANSNDNIDFSTLKKMCGLDIEKVAMFSQWFFTDQTYVGFFKNMKVSTTYRFNPIEIADVPLHMVYRMHEKELMVQYMYDPGFFNEIKPEGFHKALCAILDNIYEGLSVLPDIQGLLNTSGDREKMLREIKTKFAQNSDLFKDIPKQVLDRIIELSEVKAYYLTHRIIPIDAKVDTMYMILSGKVIIEGLDFEHMIKPLSVLKEKDIFGWEGLSESAVSKVNYVVESDRCILLEVKVKYMQDIFSEYPKCQRKMMDIILNHLYKFQRLWMLS